MWSAPRTAPGAILVTMNMRETRKRVRRYRDADRVDQILDMSERLSDRASRLAEERAVVDSEAREIARLEEELSQALESPVHAEREAELRARRDSHGEALASVQRTSEELATLQADVNALAAVVLPAIQAKAARNTHFATWALVLATVALLVATIFTGLAASRL